MKNFLTNPTSYILVTLFYFTFLLGYFLGGAYVGLLFFTCFMVSFVAACMFNVVSNLKS